MSCKIIYNNQDYTIESFKDFLVKNKNLFLQDFISQDIEGFKEFINNRQENNIQFQQSEQIIPTQLSKTYDYVFQKLFDNFKPYVTELITDRDRAEEILQRYDNNTAYQDTDEDNKTKWDAKWKHDAIQYLPNGNVLITGYRTDLVEGMTGTLPQRGKGLYLSLDRPLRGQGYSTMQIELSPKEIVETSYPPKFWKDLLAMSDEEIKERGFDRKQIEKFINSDEYGHFIKNAVFAGDLEETRDSDGHLTFALMKSDYLRQGIKAAIGLIESGIPSLGRELVIYDNDTIEKTLSSKRVLSEEEFAKEFLDYYDRSNTKRNVDYQDLSESNNENQITEFSNTEASYTWNINTDSDNILKRLRLKYPDLDFTIIKEQQNNGEVLKAKIKPAKLRRLNLNNPIVESLDLDIFTIDEKLENKRINIKLFLQGNVGIVMNNAIYYIERDMFSMTPLKISLSEDDMKGLEDFNIMSTDMIFSKATNDNVVIMEKIEYDNIKKELYKASRKIQDSMQQQVPSKIELLKRIKANTPHKYYELLVDQLLNNLPIFKDKKVRLSNNVNISYYEERTDKVYYTLDYINNTMVLLHELMHNFKNKVSIKKLSESDEKFFNKLKVLYEKALGYSIKSDRELFRGSEEKMGIDGNTYYGLTNINEFLAESMVNPEFQEYLASIKTESNNSILSEIYQALIEFIKDILNTDINNESNLLKDTIDTIVDFMENHNIYENIGEDLQWDKWKIQMITIDPNMTFEVWQQLTNKEKIKIINCI